MTSHVARRLLSLGCAAGLLACTSPYGPSGNQLGVPTLRVTNQTCGSGACRTIEVRLFDWHLTIPQPPWGYKVVGEVRGATGCLTFQEPWEFKVREVDSTGATVDSTIFTLSVNDLVFLSAVDSADFHSGLVNPAATFRGFTSNFTPADASGWSAVFQGGTVTTEARASAPCAP